MCKKSARGRARNTLSSSYTLKIQNAHNTIGTAAAAVKTLEQSSSTWSTWLIFLISVSWDRERERRCMRARVTELILFFARPTEWASQDAHRREKNNKNRANMTAADHFLLVAVNCVHWVAKDGKWYIFKADGPSAFVVRCEKFRWDRNLQALYGVTFFSAARTKPKPPLFARVAIHLRLPLV